MLLHFLSVESMERCENPAQLTSWLQNCMRPCDERCRAWNSFFHGFTLWNKRFTHLVTAVFDRVRGGQPHDNTTCSGSRIPPRAGRRNRCVCLEGARSFDNCGNSARRQNLVALVQRITSERKNRPGTATGDPGASTKVP